MKTRRVEMKVLRHRPTGKFVKLDMADALYGWAGDQVEEATMFARETTLAEAMEGVEFQFAEAEPKDFEMVAVAVTYEWEP